MDGASVPEAAIHKHRHALPAENKIRLPKKLNIPPPARDVVLTKQRHQPQLGFFVSLASDPRHNFGTFFPCENIRHDEGLKLQILIRSGKPKDSITQGNLVIEKSPIIFFKHSFFHLNRLDLFQYKDGSKVIHQNIFCNGHTRRTRFAKFIMLIPGFPFAQIVCDNARGEGFEIRAEIGKQSLLPPNFSLAIIGCFFCLNGHACSSFHQHIFTVPRERFGRGF